MATPLSRHRNMPIRHKPSASLLTEIPAARTRHLIRKLRSEPEIEAGACADTAKSGIYGDVQTGAIIAP